jgi:hypothetical protein
MSCAIPPGQFPEWKKGKFVPDMSSIAMARGQVEEAMGALDDNDRQGACTCAPATPAEARAALWSGIGCFMLAFAIVFGFGLMVIDALPDP